MGVTTAKVLCYASGAKLVGVSSLEIRALQAKTTREQIVVMLDARKGNVYAAVYKKNERNLPQVVRKPVLMGQAVFLKNVSASAVFIREDVYPSAADLAHIALDRLRQNKFLDPFEAEPSYLHPKDCNVIIKRNK